jgi:uncharacterized protein (UPF0335 family)
MAKKAEKVEREQGGIAADRLRSIIERIERLDEEKKALQSDIKDIMLEAKSAGFTPKAIRVVLKIRKMEPQVREELNVEVATYLRALGDNRAGEDEL